MKAFPSPNINPQPKSKKPKEDIAKIIKVFDKMFTQFFERANPLSNVAKLKFMKNTSMPVKTTQRVSRTT